MSLLIMTGWSTAAVVALCVSAVVGAGAVLSVVLATRGSADRTRPRGAPRSGRAGVSRAVAATGDSASAATVPDGDHRSAIVASAPPAVRRRSAAAGERSGGDQ
ncbi:hypothetical protein D9V30_00265 [Mycetocola reblochoni]|uniref:Uncharacterized protein n=2 Tax=Mycetocola reblochoni TaxID=331618 RepID=A0A1R4IXM4_9MICO|nr:hypothetical protein D9V30_00265 [Mycetocola reblochoni]SJN24622.1 hypothetical protein FM119_04370 [Mycetocola reblochoni REB411]